MWTTCLQTWKRERLWQVGGIGQVFGVFRMQSWRQRRPSWAKLCLSKDLTTGEGCRWGWGLNIARSRTAVMFHTHLCLIFREMNSSGLSVREFKGGRISVVSHIDHWNNMMSIYLWHSLYKWLYDWNPNNIPTPRENHSWCSWGRIQKTYEVGGQISIMMLSLAKNNLICKCCLPDTFHTQYFIFKS